MLTQSTLTHFRESYCKTYFRPTNLRSAALGLRRIGEAGVCLQAWRRPRVCVCVRTSNYKRVSAQKSALFKERTEE